MKSEQVLDPAAESFYRRSIQILNEAEIPFLVAGAYAFAHYTGIVRHTKDFDVFLEQEYVDDALQAFERAGYASNLTFPHWLAKAHSGDYFVDLIFRSGNGVSPVTPEWFQHADNVEIFGEVCLLCPAEEIIWQKAYIQERERFDGADVLHLIQARAEVLDWERLERIFGAHYRVLLVHLILFGFVYPGEQHRIPSGLLLRLTSYLNKNQPEDESRVCRGTLLSRAQYLHDVNIQGYRDARLLPQGYMTLQEVQLWTEAIDDC